MLGWKLLIFNLQDNCQIFPLIFFLTSKTTFSTLFIIKPVFVIAAAVFIIRTSKLNTLLFHNNGHYSVRVNLIFNQIQLMELNCLSKCNRWVFFNWLQLLYWSDRLFVLLVFDFNKQREYVIYLKTLYNIVVQILYFYKRVLVCFIITPCLVWVLIAKEPGLLKGHWA